MKNMKSFSLKMIAVSFMLTTLTACFHTYDASKVPTTPTSPSTGAGTYNY